MAETIVVWLVPTVGLDYAARGVFPCARIKRHPNGAPMSTGIEVDRDTAEQMLLDARARPQQLRAVPGASRQRAHSAPWTKLVAELEFALLPKDEQKARRTAAAEARAARDRSYAWFMAAADKYGEHSILGKFVDEMRTSSPERDLEILERVRTLALGRHGCSMTREMLAVVEECFEANREGELDAASWRRAGDAITRARRAAVSEPPSSQHHR